MQKLTANYFQGELTVSGEFLYSSTAVGLIIIIYSLSNPSDVKYLSFTRSASQQMFLASFQGLSSGPQNISFFTIEKNGLPFSRSATTVKRVFVNEVNSNSHLSKHSHNRKIYIIILL